MSVFDKFEKGIEKGVNSVFSKFGSKDLKPVDLMTKLKINVDTHASQNSDGVVSAPNSFEIKLSTSAYDKVESWGTESFVEELTSALSDYSQKQGYAFAGPLDIRFVEDLDMPDGEFEVVSEPISGSPLRELKQSESPSPRSASAPEPPIPSVLPQPTPAIEIPEPAIDLENFNPRLLIGNQVVALSKPLMILGRDPSADITVEDSGVSRQHLEFKIDGNTVIVTDLGSTNGLYVEGHHTPAALLQHGNVINVGRTKIIYQQ